MTVRIRRLRPLLAVALTMTVLIAGCGTVQSALPSPVPTTSTLREPQFSSPVTVLAYGCGGVTAGSGWVLRRGYVVTAAHVVAGSKNITIVSGVETYSTKPVYFDPDTDMAVLAVAGLQLPSSPLAKSDPSRGTAAYFAGYPQGGAGLDVMGVGIRGVVTLSTNNIYGPHTVVRRAVILSATLVPGDSGGPILDASGHVIGMAVDRLVGHAATATAVPESEIRPLVHGYGSTGISTGRCLDGQG